MKKYLLFIIICISSFMIYTNNVKADSCDNVLTSQMNAVAWKTGSLTNGYNTFTHNLDSVVVFEKKYDYIRFPIFWSLQSSTGYLSNINFDLVCSSTNSSPRDYEVTYADGSHAYISSEYNFSNYCNEYISSLNNLGTGNYTFQPNLSNVHVSMIYNGGSGVSFCDVSQYGIVTCARPNVENVSINGFRFYFSISQGNSNIYYGAMSSYVDYCTSTNNTISNNSTNISNNTTEIKNDIKNDNTSGAESSADNLKNNSAFQDNTGLSGVISMPLTFVNSLTNTCQPINLNIPYMDVDVTIPCMQSIITNKMPLLANLIKIVVNGFIVYRILLDIFQIVRNAKNPEDDRIEVLDL